MRNVIIAAGFFFCATLGASAQNNTNNLPHSLTYNQTVSDIPKEILSKPNTASLLAEDLEREKQGVFYRTGVFINPQAEITESSGLWMNNMDGSVSWFLTFKASDAQALGIYFDNFTIPAQGKLFVYNATKSHIVGPYTAKNSAVNDLFATAPVVGDEITLEYNGPASTAEEFNVSINEIAYMYRDGGFAPRNAGEYGDSDPCEVNVNCSEGASWTAQRRSVVKIIVRDGSSAGLCSGALVNSTNGDCTPYVLTANHCGGGATVSNFKQWVFYFNFETPGCTNPPSADNLDDQTVTGCLKMASAGDVSDVVASDFLLVHLKDRPAASYNAFMAGWSRSVVPATSGVGIHHPAGDVKKISTYNSILLTASWSGSNLAKHWGVQWVATANGHGVTEGGSSGSPLFDQIGRIVGDLSGGGSFCNNTSGQDLYGKFSYSWDQVGTTSNRRLKDWLDKTNVNSTTLNGKEVSTCAVVSLPTVDFVASNTTPSVGELVNLTNQTTGGVGYVWQITPTTFNYLNGTNENSENPQVQFSSTSSYSVTLNVYNTAGYAFRTRSAYIKPHSTASIEENAGKLPMLFPNPTNGIFQINGQESAIEKVEITDMNGKTVYTWAGKKMNVQVDIHEFAKGIYTVKIAAGKTTSLEKLILQ